MRIAFPTVDGIHLSGHFGRCQSFLVLTVDGGVLLGREVRPNTPHHASGEGHVHGHHGHDHRAFVALLGDCDAVLCGGIGPGARRTLEGAGLTVRLVPLEGSPDALALAHAAGTLQERPGVSCHAGDPCTAQG